MPFQLPELPSFTPQIQQMPDVMQKYGQMLQLKSLMGQQQMLPYQMQVEQERAKQAGIATQMQQAELQSQQAMIKAWSDPKFLDSFTGSDTSKANGLGFDPDAMVKSLAAQGVLPKDALSLSNMFIERSQKMAEIAKAQAQTSEAGAVTRDKGWKALADRIAGVMDAPSSKAGDLLAQLKQDLVHGSEAFAGVPQDDLAHVYSADLEHLPAMATLIGLDAKIADFHKSKADAAKAQQGVIPEGGGLSPETAQQVAKDVAVYTNPQIQAGKVAVAEAEGRARAAIEAQVARGSQAALANVPTHLVGPATEAAQKAGGDYAQAKSVSDRIAKIMDAAKRGNVESYQLIPQEGALQVTTSQGVHRINMTEIEQYGGAGSIFQRLEGRLGKAITGKSIPDSVLNDMKEMQDVMAQGSRSKYENTLKTINQTYGANFKPVEMEGLEGVGNVTVTDPRGGIHTFRDQASADKFKKLAGIQ